MDKINFKQVQYSVLGVFLVIIGILIWYLNTDYFVKKDYYHFKDEGFNSTLFKKVEIHPTRGNKIFLNTGMELVLDRGLFDKLQVGDSVVKIVGSDSIYFYTNQGLIIHDYNEFKRKKFMKSLK
ncbi:hypothetical protein DKG77_01960 [Flagellimonas aquimarina]|uniref:Uncharacterized protein n=1 Tax=Flagellimonas aquimarina TaxID=2201895 RepID=A0A316L1B2_9FLAO|nr:hypothetical protein [Allomuricauda koreensis]PWL39621.1 hypothetical protein DKG77_01960 [Allomuricauda koreensis]